MTDDGTLTDAELGALDPAAVPAAGQPNRRGMLLRTGLIVGILFVVFVVILPRYVSYQDVIEAFGDLTLPQIAVMTVLGIAGWVISGQVFTALIPGLGPRKGTDSFLILSGMGSSIPAGPWNMAVVWVVQRGWGVANAAASAGIGLYGIVNILGRLFLPLLAILLLVVSGQMPADADARTAWLITIISIVAFFVASGVILAIVRSERLATSAAGKLQAFTDAVIRRVGRPMTADVTTAVLNFRAHLGDVIQRRGALAITISIGSSIWWAAVLVIALRFCGVPESALTAADIFAVYALVFVITIVPIAPGGAGVPELLFISGLTAIAGDEWTNQITAGVFLYRAYWWFLPIPLAWILLKAARRGKSMLPSTAELKASATGAEVA